MARLKCACGFYNRDKPHRCMGGQLVNQQPATAPPPKEADPVCYAHINLDTSTSYTSQAGLMASLRPGATVRCVNCGGTGEEVWVYAGSHKWFEEDAVHGAWRIHKIFH